MRVSLFPEPAKPDHSADSVNAALQTGRRPGPPDFVFRRACHPARFRAWNGWMVLAMNGLPVHAALMKRENQFVFGRLALLGFRCWAA